jgi:hypothetical protein
MEAELITETARHFVSPCKPSAGSTGIPQSKSKIPEAGWNPGAAKASDYENFKVILRSRT